MSKTKELRKIVKAILDTSTGETYYENATDDGVYPFKVFSFDNVNLGDTARDDVMLVVDVWGDSVSDVEYVADEIEASLNCKNNPQGNSYPTFYKDMRYTVFDENKAIKHKQLKFIIQNYYIGE